MTEHDVNVCPRCGEPAANYRFCPSCGLSIVSASEAPTRTAPEAGGAIAHAAEETSTASIVDLDFDRSSPEDAVLEPATAVLEADESPMAGEDTGDAAHTALPEPLQPAWYEKLPTAQPNGASEHSEESHATLGQAEPEDSDPCPPPVQAPLRPLTFGGSSPSEANGANADGEEETSTAAVNGVRFDRAAPQDRTADPVAVTPLQPRTVVAIEIDRSARSRRVTFACLAAAIGLLLLLTIGRPRR